MYACVYIFVVWKCFVYPPKKQYINLYKDGGFLFSGSGFEMAVKPLLNYLYKLYHLSHYLNHVFGDSNQIKQWRVSKIMIFFNCEI